jgi:hypothetical protein
MKRIPQLNAARALALALFVAMVMAVSGVSKAQYDLGCEHCHWARVNTNTWRWVCSYTTSETARKWCTVEPDGSSCIDYGICGGSGGINPNSPTVVSDSSIKELQAALAQEDFRTATIFQVALQSLKDKFGNTWPSWANVHLALYLHQKEDPTITMLPTIRMEVEGDKVTLTIQNGKGVPRDARGKTISVANVR